MSSDISDAEETTDSSSSSEEEDENAKEWTDEIEKTFLKTLSSLKKKDPKIYDNKVKFFKDELISSRHPPAPKEEHIYLRDYERKIILEKNGILTDEDSDEEKAVEAANERAHSPSYVEEQRILKENFKKMLHDSDANDSEDDTAGFLKVKKKTVQEKAEEEADYVEWLKGQKNELEDKETEQDLKYLRDYWTDPNLNEGEQFLRDYVLNKKYLEPDQDSQSESELSFSEEEKQLEECDEYEQKYNFRFEEPDQNFIKTYPRVIENSLRRNDERRKLKREALKKRKEEELAKKRLEVKKLKKQKKQELLEKIKSLKEITGNSELAFNDEDLQKDFSPDEYDKRMSQLFNEEFYELDDMDDIKPQFSDSDSFDFENEDETAKGNDGNHEAFSEIDELGADENEVQNDNSEIIMDCDYDPSKIKESKFKRQTRSSRRKGHKKSKLMEVVAKEKKVFNASEKTFEQYLDEYYGLDFEDTIGDMPCRFKYRKVPANSFGLTIEEILAADDKELNKWVPMQKIDTIRPENIEKFEQKAYVKKANNVNLKRKLLPSLFTEEQQEDTKANVGIVEAPIKKTKKKKKRKIVKIDSNGVDVIQTKQSDVTKTSENKNKEKMNRKRKANDNDNNAPPKKEKMNRKRKANDNDNKAPPKKSFKPNNPKFNQEKNRENNFKNSKFKNRNDTCEFADERLKAYGINPKKYKNKLKYAPK